MKTKLLKFLLIFVLYGMNHATQKYLLTSTKQPSIWLEINNNFSFELVDSETRYTLLQSKDNIFEGAYLLYSSSKTKNIVVLIGLKTIAKSRDLRLTGYVFSITDQGVIQKRPNRLEYLDSFIFEAGRLIKKGDQLFVQEEIKPYGISMANRNGEQLPLLKEFKIRYRETLQISEPRWPIPLTSLDYLNLAHSMKSYKLFKKAAALYTIGLNRQNRHLHILDNFRRELVHYDFAESLMEAGYPKRAKIVLKSLGSRLNRKSKLRTPVYKLYKRSLKELGED